MRVWVRAAREAHVIFDVGANTGLYALVAKAVAPQATVVAFEPVARVRAKLQENVDLNRFDLEIVPAGMSDRDGVAVMLDSDEEHEISATLDAAGAVQSGRVLREVSVPVARLDTLISAGMLPPPDLLKIDVEGHEGAVLRGMADHLEASRPALLIEVVTSDAADRVDRLIRPFGYLTYRLDQGGPSACPRSLRPKQLPPHPAYPPTPPLLLPPLRASAGPSCSRASMTCCYGRAAAAVSRVWCRDEDPRVSDRSARRLRHPPPPRPPPQTPAHLARPRTAPERSPRRAPRSVSCLRPRRARPRPGIRLRPVRARRLRPLTFPRPVGRRISPPTSIPAHPRIQAAHSDFPTSSSVQPASFRVARPHGFRPAPPQPAAPPTSCHWTCPDSVDG